MTRETWGALRRAPVERVAAYLRDVEPADLLREIRESDDDLLDALGAAAGAPAILEGVLRRADLLAVPARAARLDGTVRWEAGPTTAATVRLSSGTTLLAPDAEPDLVVRGSLAQLLRLVAGQLDVAVAYLGARLSLTGDSALALDLAGSFAADGTEPVHGTPVDPRDIDPVAVAGALHGVDEEHLRSVMASGFRQVVLDEVFGRMPDHVDPRKAARARATVGFRLTGRPDGEVDRYVLRLSEGRASVLAGDAADAVATVDRDATVTCAAHDFLRLATGHLSAVTGVLRGRLRVEGDKVAALRLASAFDIPRAAAG